MKVLLDVRAFASRKESALVSAMSIFWEEEQKTINFLCSTSAGKLTGAVLRLPANCCACACVHVSGGLESISEETTWLYKLGYAFCHRVPVCLEKFVS